MYLLSCVQKKAGMGRFVSLVTGFALSKGSSVRFTQMFRVLLSGFRKAMNLPSGDNEAPEISGSPKKSSRSIIGGCWATAEAVRNAAANTNFTRTCMKDPPVFTRE